MQGFDILSKNTFVECVHCGKLNDPCLGFWKCGCQSCSHSMRPDVIIFCGDCASFDKDGIWCGDVCGNVMCLSHKTFSCEFDNCKASLCFECSQHICDLCHKIICFEHSGHDENDILKCRKCLEN